MGARPAPADLAHRTPPRRVRLVGAPVLAALVGLTGSAALAGCGDGLPDKGAVVGTVLDGQQAVCRNCSITRSVQGSNPYPLTEEAAATDRSGVFRWEMYPGTYLITAVCPSGRRELRGISGDVDVSSGANTTVTITVK